MHVNSNVMATHGMNAQPQTLQLQTSPHARSHHHHLSNNDSRFVQAAKLVATAHSSLFSGNHLKQTNATSLALNSRRNSKQPVSLTIVAPALNISAAQNNRLLLRNGDITKQDIDVINFDASVAAAQAGAVT